MECRMDKRVSQRKNGELMEGLNKHCKGHTGISAIALKVPVWYEGTPLPYTHRMATSSQLYHPSPSRPPPPLQLPHPFPTQVRFMYQGQSNFNVSNLVIYVVV